MEITWTYVLERISQWSVALGILGLLSIPVLLNRIIKIFHSVHDAKQARKNAEVMIHNNYKNFSVKVGNASVNANDREEIFVKKIKH